MDTKRGAKQTKKIQQDRGVSIPVSVIKRTKDQKVKSSQRFSGDVKKREVNSFSQTPVLRFSGHRQVNALASIFAQQPRSFKDSMMREIVPSAKILKGEITFPSMAEIRKELGEHICRECNEAHDYGIPESFTRGVPHDVLHVMIPKSWIRSGLRCGDGALCPAASSIAHFSINPQLQLHEIRHAYAHAGGWASLELDDRLRVAHALKQRLAASDRIRFAHVERVSNRADHIREYWAELLAFALSIEAEQEADWSRSFLARAVQRSAGAALAYPSSDTGVRDLELVRWYFKQADIHEPWVFAKRANDWISESEKSRRADRVRYAISGFPPGKVRMIFSSFVDADSATSDVTHSINRLQLNIPDHLVAWVEQACVFADHVGSVDIESNEASLLAESARLAAALERFSEVDQQRALKYVQEYIHQKVNASV